MSVTTLRELFVDQLKDMYDAEQRITKTLPKMAKSAQSDELREAFESHLEETEEHVSRLEQVFETIGETAKKKTCKAIVGLIAEGDELASEAEGAALDAALIAAAQKVEHYEMATYGCLRTWADLLEEEQASRILQTTLDEEGEADKKLTDIAQSLNVEAAEGEEMEPVMVRPRNGRKSTSRSHSR